MLKNLGNGDNQLIFIAMAPRYDSSRGPSENCLSVKAANKGYQFEKAFHSEDNSYFMN